MVTINTHLPPIDKKGVKPVLSPTVLNADTVSKNNALKRWSGSKKTQSPGCSNNDQNG